MNDERITDRPTPNRAPAPGRDPDWPTVAEASQALGGFFMGGILAFFLTRGLGREPNGLLTLLGAVFGGMIVWSSVYTRRARGVRVRNEALPAGDRPRQPALPWSETVTTAPIHKPNIDRLGGHRRGISGLAFSPDGGHLTSCDEEGVVVVHDLKTGFEVWAGRDFPYSAVDLAYSPDGRLLAVSGYDSAPGNHHFRRTSVRVYDALDGRELRRIELYVLVGPLVFLPDRRLLIGLSDRLGVWELEGPSEQQVIPPSKFKSFAPDHVATLALRGGVVIVGCLCSIARVLRLESGEEILSFDEHKRSFGFARLASVVAVAVSPSGKHVLSGGHDGYARIWALRSGEELLRFEGHWGWWGWHGVTGVGWLSEDEAVSAGEDGTLRRWDAHTGQELECYRHGPYIRRLALLGRTAATGASDGSIRLWALT